MNDMNQTSILIVDDQRDNRTLLEFLLDGEFKVVSVASGEECLAELEKRDFDLVLMDIMMPGLSGYETARRISQSPKTWRLPVVFLSAQPQELDEGESFFAGGYAYLEKPIDDEALFDVIHEILAEADDEAGEMH
jgi:CheY-like chemotaxis protein